MLTVSPLRAGRIMDALPVDRNLPYSDGCKIHTARRRGGVVGYVTKDGRRVSEEKLFATESGAVNYWNDQYHRGGLKAQLSR